MGRAFGMHGEKRNAYGVLVGKPEGRSPLGRCGCKWEDNIKMVHKEIWSDILDCLHLAEDTSK
jgi:hypothetical protein